MQGRINYPNYTRAILAGLILLFFFKNAAAQIDTLIIAARTSGLGADKKEFSDWKDYPTRVISLRMPALAGVKMTSTNQYGSRTDQRSDSTGFFHTRQLRGRWYVIDPEGYPFICRAINSINTGKIDLDDRSVKTKFKDKSEWLKETASLIHRNGFNVAGSWSDVGAILDYNKYADTPLVYTVMLDWMSDYGKQRGGTYAQPGHTGYPNNTIFVFDPGFKAYCEEQAKGLLRYKKDTFLFGYFSDNEMPLNPQNLEGYLSLTDKKDPGYLAARNWLASRKVLQNEINDKIRVEFLAYVAETYFSIVSSSIKKYDPNHLYVGSRLYSAEKNIPEFFEAAGKYVDILSINYYHVWSPSPALVDKWTKWSGKPFMITEYYAKAMDSGLANTTGAGWVVKTQQDRGAFYQNFCLNLLRSKNCVGWHWFKYQDNDPNDKRAEASNSDSNKGIVTAGFEPFRTILLWMKNLNEMTYQLIDYDDAIHQ